MVFAFFAAFMLLLGFIGTFLPVLPGPPLAWAGLLLAFFSANCDVSAQILVITGVVAAIVTIIDNIAPGYCTKKAGGSKAAVIGSTVGLLIGIFINPIFIIIGPFLGALIGELIFADKEAGLAFKAAFGAFLGFLMGTGIKLITVAWFVWIFAKSFSM